MIPFRSSLLRHHDGKELIAWYKHQDQCLPAIFVFEFFTVYLDRSDAQRLCYGFFISGHSFKMSMGDYIWLICAGGWLARWLHRDGRDTIIYLYALAHTDIPFKLMHEEIKYERRSSESFI